MLVGSIFVTECSLNILTSHMGVIIVLPLFNHNSFHTRTHYLVYAMPRKYSSRRARPLRRKKTLSRRKSRMPRSRRATIRGRNEVGMLRVTKSKAHKFKTKNKPPGTKDNQELRKAFDSLRPSYVSALSNYRGNLSGQADIARAAGVISAASILKTFMPEPAADYIASFAGDYAQNLYGKMTDPVSTFKGFMGYPGYNATSQTFLPPTNSSTPTPTPRPTHHSNTTLIEDIKAMEKKHPSFKDYLRKFFVPDDAIRTMFR